MRSETGARYDRTGKIVMDGIYDRADPRHYFNTLDQLDYEIPAHAAPVFRELIAALRDARGEDRVRVVDIGCSYGVNAAILKHGVPLDELYAHYGDPALAGLDRDALIARDRAFYDAHEGDEALEMVGLDVAGNAVDYAVEAAILDDGLSTDLEKERLAAADRPAIAAADMAISTGCVGYVSDRTLTQIADAGGERPWMAHCVLRMFDYAPYAAALAERGYVTETLPGTFPQRRFASPEEKAHVLANLERLGVDPAGREADGWYHASLFVSRPAAEAEETPLARMLQ